MQSVFSLGVSATSFRVYGLRLKGFRVQGLGFRGTPNPQKRWQARDGETLKPQTQNSNLNQKLEFKTQGFPFWGVQGPHQQHADGSCWPLKGWTIGTGESLLNKQPYLMVTLVKKYFEYRQTQAQDPKSTQRSPHLPVWQDHRPRRSTSECRGSLGSVSCLCAVLQSSRA